MAEQQFKQRLGDILLEKGLITPAQLEEGLEIQHETGARLGDVVVARGWVKAHELYEALTAQQGEGFKVKIGDILLHKGLVTSKQLDEALEIQRRWGTRLGDIVMSKGWVRAYQFYQALADVTGFPFINLTTDPTDPTLYKSDDYDEYMRLLVLPWTKMDDIVWVVTANPTDEVMAYARQHFGDNVQFALTSKFDIIWELQRNANAFISDRALHHLLRQDPEHSAWSVFSSGQLLAMYAFVCLLVLSLILWPLLTLIWINVIVTIVILANFILKIMLVWVSSDHRIDIKVFEHEIKALDEALLPTYTVLVPMYKEPEVLPIIADALRHMDYPLSKLDIKLILEEDDDETIDTAKALGLESIFEIIRVPPSEPKTKPKACNYALQFARGEYVTIYDAEDKPRPDQLKAVVVAFKKAAPEVACIQARLSYFNVDENWLTKMFTLEYALWFDFYLPAMEKLRIPIPLGGTSNHFKMGVLREVLMWDPYNMTEDADLGVRLTAKGYRVGLVNSTTFEEANNSVNNWIRQRSRWVKGYMQTYLVHMRHPMDLYRTQGPAGFWGFQFFVGGSIVAYLAAPILWTIFFVWLLSRTRIFEFMFPPVILYINLFNLIIGNGYFVYASMLGPFKRRMYHLTPYALTMPFYWVLMSLAGYKALWQLIFKPFFWEKTRHGISKYSQAERESALLSKAG